MTGSDFSQDPVPVPADQAQVLKQLDGLLRFGGGDGRLQHARQFAVVVLERMEREHFAYDAVVPFFIEGVLRRVHVLEVGLGKGNDPFEIPLLLRMPFALVEQHEQFEIRGLVLLEGEEFGEAGQGLRRDVGFALEDLGEGAGGFEADGLRDVPVGEFLARSPFCFVIIPQELAVVGIGVEINHGDFP